MAQSPPDQVQTVGSGESALQLLLTATLSTAGIALISYSIGFVVQQSNHALLGFTSLFTPATPTDYLVQAGNFYYDTLFTLLVFFESAWPIVALMILVLALWCCHKFTRSFKTPIFVSTIILLAQFYFFFYPAVEIENLLYQIVDYRLTTYRDPFSARRFTNFRWSVVCRSHADGCSCEDPKKVIPEDICGDRKYANDHSAYLQKQYLYEVLLVIGAIGTCIIALHRQTLLLAERLQLLQLDY